MVYIIGAPIIYPIGGSYSRRVYSYRRSTYGYRQDRYRPPPICIPFIAVKRIDCHRIAMPTIRSPTIRIKKKEMAARRARRRLSPAAQNDARANNLSIAMTTILRIVAYRTWGRTLPRRGREPPGPYRTQVLPFRSRGCSGRPAPRVAPAVLQGAI